MDKKQNSRWVLVTGASSGIGRASVTCLASDGFSVYAGVRNESDFSTFRQMDHVLPLELDVTKPGDIENAYQSIMDKGTGLYGIVNNAGIANDIKVAKE